jgi:hypothetical protein
MISARFLRLRQDLDSQIVSCRRVAQACADNERGKNMQDYLIEKRVNAYRRYWVLVEELEAIKTKGVK